MAQQTSRKIFFGSFFTFTPAGHHEVAESFQRTFTDVSSAPFVGFDRKRNTFVLESVDQETEENFASKLEAFIESGSAESKDLVDIPSIVRVPGTALPCNDEDGEEIFSSHLEQLIECDDGSDCSSESSSSSNNQTAYWKPKSGNINILSRDTAKNIADLTACFIEPQILEGRFKLWCGDIFEALKLLQQLEPVMELQYRHITGSASDVNTNILFLSQKGLPTFVQYNSILASTALDRVMVDKVLNSTIERMLIGEQWEYHPLRDVFVLSKNLKLDAIQPTSGFGESKLWKGQEMPSIGNTSSTVQTLSKISTSSDHAEDSSTSGFQTESLRSRYLAPREQNRLTEWSKNVPTEAFSNETNSLFVQSKTDDKFDQEEGQVDGEVLVRRYIASDSDSESEADTCTAKSKCPQSVQEHFDEKPDSKISKDVKAINSTQQSATISVVPELLSSKKARVKSSSLRSSSPTTTNRGKQKKIPLDHAAFYAGVVTEEENRSSSNIHPTDERCNPKNKHFDTNSSINQYQGHESFSKPLKANTRHSAPTESRNNGLYANVETDFPSVLTSSVHREDINAVISHSNEINQYGSRLSSNTNNHQQKLPTNAHRDFCEVNREPGRKDHRVQQNSHSEHQSRSPPHLSFAKSVAQSSNDDRSALRFNAQERLIELGSENASRTNAAPPPGLDIHQLHPSTSATQNAFLDDTIEEAGMLAIRTRSNELQPNHGGSNSMSGTTSSEGRRTHYAYDAQVRVPKLDIDYVREAAIAQFQAINSQPDSAATAKEDMLNSPQRQIEKDEVKTRRFYNTMNLKARNPKTRNKKKNTTTSQPESKKERDKRIAAAKAEAYPQNPPEQTWTRKGLDSNTSPLTSTANLSKRTKQAMKENPSMAQLHAARLQDDATVDQTRQLAADLKDIAAAADIYCGSIQFEIQFGQVLVSSNSSVMANHKYDRKQWNTLFSAKGVRPHVCFSNIITNNGHDIDHLLEIKNSDEIPMWHEARPGPSDIRYEFYCQENTGEDFVVALDSQGVHKIHKGQAVIGKIALHLPDQIWDGCAVISGTREWLEISTSLSEVVTKFVSSIYAPHGTKMIIYNRLPSSPVFTVRSVVSRRTSMHDCLLADHTEVQLKIMEVKNLYTMRHRRDSTLLCSTERDLGQMAHDGRFHYEVSLVHKSINQVLDERKVHDLTDILRVEPASSSCLTIENLLPLVRTFLQTGERIDWMGMYNVGTVRQKLEQQQQKQESFARSIPPTALHSGSGMPIHLLAMSTVAGRSLRLPTEVSTEDGRALSMSGTALPFIHGVRTGTEAEMFIDEAGTPYRLGLGGARIPVIFKDCNSVISTEIKPDDSTSQFGGQRLKFLPRSRRDDPGFW